MSNNKIKLQAKIIPLASRISVESLDARVGDKQKIAVCFSGGGSRTLAGCMGQMRALQNLTTPDGKSLLEQARLVVYVSGSAWIGLPFQYLDKAITNEEFLNGYVPDQSKLVVHKNSGSTLAETISLLPEKCIGNGVNELFDIPSLAINVLLDYLCKGIPLDDIWIHIMAEHFLRPYGLGDVKYFCLYEKQKQEILAKNLNLKDSDFYVAESSAPGREKTNFYDCLTAIYTKNEGTYQYLAPVIINPFYSGAFGFPSGMDVNNRAVGGGGVSTFAFNSVLDSVTGEQVSVQQRSPFSLAELNGLSSAFYANIVINQLSKWKENPADLLQSLNTYLKTAKLEKNLNASVPPFLQRIIDLLPLELKKDNLVAEFFFKDLVKKLEKELIEMSHILDFLTDLVPDVYYWPIRNISPDTSIKPTRFADGGDLEDTGVASTLLYEDIDKILLFLNCMTILAPADIGILDERGQEIPGTRMIIDEQLPPLFGYQPYEKGKGYVLYKQAPLGTKPDQGLHNQVFQSSDFVPLVKKVMQTTGKNFNTNSAVISISLTVVDNEWYGVKGGRTIDFLLGYTNRVKKWYDLLSKDVQEVLGDFNDPDSCNGFPHFNTQKHSELSNNEINLLANLTCWNVTQPDVRSTFVNFFGA